MPDTQGNPTKTKRWGRRGLITLLCFFCTFLIFGVAGRFWITTDSGAAFIESQIEKRTFGPVKQIDIYGLTGDPLGAFKVGELKLYDKNGHFLTLTDMAMDWSPWAFRNRHLKIESLQIADADVLRRPEMEASNEAPSKPITFDVQEIAISQLILREPVIGQSATLQVAAQASQPQDGTLRALLDVKRTDIEGDALSLNIQQSANGVLDGTFELTGLPDGTVATILRAPVQATVSGSGNIQGTLDEGEGNVRIAFDDTPAIVGALSWTAVEAEIEASLTTTDWPLFETSRPALGDTLAVSAKLDRSRKLQPFSAAVIAENLTADIFGDLGEDISAPERFKFEVHSARMGQILPLPQGYSLGASSAKGDLNLGENLSMQAAIDLSKVVTPYGQFEAIRGPIDVSGRNGRFNFETNLTAAKPLATAELPLTLGATATLSSKGLINVDAQRVTELETVLTTAGNQTTAKGSLYLDGSVLNLSGQAQLNIKAIGAVPAGRVDTQYQLTKEKLSDLAVSAQGKFSVREPFPAPLDGLIEDDINYDVRMKPVTGGVNINEALIISAGLQAAISGDIGDQLDLAAEVLMSRSVNVSALEVEAPAQVSATITGARLDPNLRLDGTFESAIVAGQAFEDVRLRAELSDLLTAPRGPVRIVAETEYGSLDAEARLALTPRGYTFDDLNIAIADLTLGGDVALDRNSIATGRLALNLPQDGERYARALLELSDRQGEQGISLKAEAQSVAYNAFAIETLSAVVSGTLASLAGDIVVEGRRTDSLLVREFGLETPLELTRSPDTGYKLTLTPDADYGRYKIGHTEAVTIEYDAGDITANAPLTLNGKSLSIQYARNEAAENLQLRTRDLPINVLPLPGALSEAKGDMSLNLTLGQGTGQQLSGQAVINIADWRGFGVDAGKGFTTTATIDIQPQAAAWRLQNSDSPEFQLSGEGRVPLNSGVTLSALRPDFMAPMQGQLKLSGSAKPLLGLLTVEDAEPDGILNAELSISGSLGAPQIEGQVSGQSLRMEVPELGTRFRDGRFKAAFTTDTIDVSDVYVRDSKDGTLEGAGVFKLGEFGRPIGRLDIAAKSFRGLDRKDYEGRASGTLYFESDDETATLGGDIKINEASVKQFVQGRAAVVDIEVEEVNGRMDDIEVEAQPKAVPLYLNLRIRAPRRVFVRTRGLDVELETDITLKGTTSEPLLFGTASVVRGGYKIAGKTLEFTEGTVKFDGKLADAKVSLTAETDTQNIAASVDISGTVAKPEVTLSSTPERPQDEILSALLFGRSVTELSGIEAAQLAGALAQFSGAGGGFDLMGGLRDALGIGQLSIGVDSDGQAVISGGRYLAKDVYLQLFRGVGPEATGAIIDWELKRNLFLRSKVQGNSEQSVSVKYKKDF